MLYYNVRTDYSRLVESKYDFAQSISTKQRLVMLFNSNSVQMMIGATPHSEPDGLWLKCWKCNQYFDKVSPGKNPCYLRCLHVACRDCLWDSNVDGVITCGYTKHCKTQEHASSEEDLRVAEVRLSV